MNIIIKQDTVLKKNNTIFKGTEQSNLLPDNLKHNLAKNTILQVLAYQEVDNHYLVTFSESIGDYNTWFIFKEHCYFCDNTLLTKVVKQYLIKDYVINDKLNEVNICGLDNKNNKEQDKFNDLILLFIVKNNVIILLSCLAATTEAGNYYRHFPLNPKGCAKLLYGQYKAWAIGVHNNKHEALVQVFSVPVVRDNVLFEEGLFGINIHHGYSSSNIDKHSAGCQVIQDKQEFNKFLNTVKSDPNYLKNKKHIFNYTLLNYNSLL